MSTDRQTGIINLKGSAAQKQWLVTHGHVLFRRRGRNKKKQTHTNKTTNDYWNPKLEGYLQNNSGLKWFDSPGSHDCVRSPGQDKGQDMDQGHLQGLHQALLGSVGLEV